MHPAHILHTYVLTAFVLGGLFFLPNSALAQMDQKEKCLVLLEHAEQNPDERVYDACGFDDEETAWNYWAPLMSQKKYKRALFELCVRYPKAAYGPLYCEKSAELEFGPALAYLGGKIMPENPALALNYYERAMKTGELTDEEIGKVSESIGLLYLTPGTEFYAPAKAIAYLGEASEKRAPLANNIMGYLSYTGAGGFARNKENAFKYFWRAILLGCPTAEENLGLFHLERQKKITPGQAAEVMSTKAFTCDSIVPEKSAMEQREEQLRKSCPCKALLADDRRLHEKPYFLISVDQKTAVVKQTGGKSITVREKETLPTGELVFEIRPTAVILTKGSDRMIINQYPNPECVDVCSKPAVSSAGNVQIKPYRLTFTKNECDTLLYYASFLVDMNKPFTGREKCMTGANGTSQDEMLALIQQRAATSAGDDETDSYSAQPPVRPVSYQLPNDPTAPEKFVMPRVMPSMAPDKSTPQAREALRVRRVLDKEAANKRRQDALKEKEEAEKNPPSKAKVK